MIFVHSALVMMGAVVGFIYKIHFAVDSGHGCPYSLAMMPPVVRYAATAASLASCCWIITAPVSAHTYDVCFVIVAVQMWCVNGEISASSAWTQIILQQIAYCYAAATCNLFPDVLLKLICPTAAFTKHAVQWMLIYVMYIIPLNCQHLITSFPLSNTMRTASSVWLILIFVWNDSKRQAQNRYTVGFAAIQRPCVVTTKCGHDQVWTTHGQTLFNAE